MATPEPVWIVPSGGTDEVGDPLPSGTPTMLMAYAVLPRKGRESNTDGVIVISGYEIFFKPPPDVEISATDAILVRAQEHQIDGPAGLYAGKALQVFTTRVGA
jgi:hypothetical protein